MILQYDNDGISLSECLLYAPLLLLNCIHIMLSEYMGIQSNQSVMILPIIITRT